MVWPRARAALLAHDLAFMVVTAGLLLARIRYGFENNDHQQYLLLPYRDIYPNFLPGDWFTWQTTHYHVTFAWIVRAIHALTGEAHFPLGMLAAHALVLAAFGAGLLALARALHFGRAAAWFALLATVFVRSRGLGGAVVNHGVFLPADAALPAFLMACAAWIGGRPRATGLWLGLAGFLHANYAVIGPLLLGVLELAVRGREPALARRVLAMAGGYALLAWPTLAVVAQGFLLPDSAPELTRVFFEVRSPHHYDVRWFSATDLIWVGYLGVLAARPLASSDARARAGVWLLCGMAALMLVGLAGSLWQVLTLIRIFLWRLSVPFGLVLLLAAGQGLSEALRERRWADLALRALGCVFVLLFAAPEGALAASRGALVLALAVLCFGAVFVWHPRLAAGSLRWVAPVAAAVALVAGLAGFVGPRALPTPDWGALTEVKPLTLRHQTRGPIGALQRWVRGHTPGDARFLVPPGFINFRIEARRAIYVDWKCTPMRGDELGEWRRRMLAAMGESDFPVVGYALRHGSTRAYERRPVEELARLARAERLTHLVTRRGARSAERAGLAQLASFGPWNVYAVAPAGSADRGAATRGRSGLELARR